MSTVKQTGYWEVKANHQWSNRSDVTVGGKRLFVIEHYAHNEDERKWIDKTVSQAPDLAAALEAIVNLEYETGKSRPYIENILSIAKAALAKL